MSTQQATPSDLEIALFLRREKHRLADWSIAPFAILRICTGRHWGHGLFSELGGKIT